jgi:hypothetical protein
MAPHVNPATVSKIGAIAFFIVGWVTPGALTLRQNVSVFFNRMSPIYDIQSASVCAMACVTSGMMQILVEAFKDRRLRVSSSHCVYASPLVRVIDTRTLHVFACPVLCLISQAGVSLSPDIGAVAVGGCTFCDTGVWLSITAGGFWLEIHVPPLTDRQIQARAQKPH